MLHSSIVCLMGPWKWWGRAFGSRELPWQVLSGTWVCSSLPAPVTVTPQAQHQIPQLWLFECLIQGVSHLQCFSPQAAFVLGGWRGQDPLIVT